MKKRDKYNTEYACYDNDKFLCIGTLKEIAKYLDLDYSTIKVYKCTKRLIFVKLDKEDNENV